MLTTATQFVRERASGRSKREEDGFAARRDAYAAALNAIGEVVHVTSAGESEVREFLRIAELNGKVEVTIPEIATHVHSSIRALGRAREAVFVASLYAEGCVISLLDDLIVELELTIRNRFTSHDGESMQWPSIRPLMNAMREDLKTSGK